MTGKQMALVTGASRGIGAAIAARLARDGFHLLVNHLPGTDEEKAAGVLRSIEKDGGSGELICFDVTQSAQIDEKVGALASRPDPLAVLVNNAGITIDGLLLRMKNEDLEKTLAVDLSGAIYCTRAVAKLMIKTRIGSMIQIASVIGQMGNAGQCSYAAAKAGLIGFTKSAARELASRNIRVNAIAPGYIATPMTEHLTEEQKKAILQQIPLGSIGQPEDVAALVSFLAGPDSRYITGQVIGVSGGMYM